MPTCASARRPPAPATTLAVRRVALAGLSSAIVSAGVHAAEAPPNLPSVQEPHAEDTYIQFRHTLSRSRARAFQRDLQATQAYMEKRLDGQWSGFLFAHHDQEFRSAEAGVARQFGDIQLGLGLGVARFDARSHVMWNPWLYYQAGRWTGVWSVERYMAEPVAPWWYKGSIEYRLAPRLFAGAYAEKDSGLGPLLGMTFGKGGKLWVAAPVAAIPRQETPNGSVRVGNRFFLGLTYGFSY